MQTALPISKHAADEAMDAATCIGCGACVATCKNSSAMLFVGAKVSQYALLPQGQVEAVDRVKNMVAQMDLEGFGNCTNTGACEIECPKGISLENIARMNRELMKASIEIIFHKLANLKYRIPSLSLGFFVSFILWIHTSKLPNVVTSIFSVMSALANEHNAINLSQGFPNFKSDQKVN